jgi:hypothetical protein
VVAAQEVRREEEEAKSGSKMQTHEKSAREKKSSLSLNNEVFPYSENCRRLGDQR